MFGFRHAAKIGMKSFITGSLTFIWAPLGFGNICDITQETSSNGKIQTEFIQGMQISKNSSGFIFAGIYLLCTLMVGSFKRKQLLYI